MNLTEQQVIALAPDSSSAANGKKLMAHHNWCSSGRNEQVLWGECQGSGSKPYQTQVDLADYASNCSCPSRKFPCKHALGLLLLAATDQDSIQIATPPQWVSEWLLKRATNVARKEAKSLAKADEPVDEEAKLKRLQKRDARVSEGLQAFQLWMEDLIRNGLARLPNEGNAIWEQQAARLVDAQAPSLAARVRGLSDLVGASKEWPQTLLNELGQIALAIRAWDQMAQWPADVQSSIRQYLGFSVTEDDVLQAGLVQNDEWQIVAQVHEQESTLRIQRNWLLGKNTGRYALILQFAAGSQAFTNTFLPGNRFGAELVFWPGAVSQRALIKGEVRPLPAADSFSDRQTYDQLFDRMSEQLAVCPWLDRLPVVLQAVVPVLDDGRWWTIDTLGRALPVLGSQHWQWLALSGGLPLDIAGEWNSAGFLPVATYMDGRYLLLTESM